MEMPKNNIHESIEELKNIPSGSAFTNLLSIYKVVSDSVAAGYAQGYDRKKSAGWNNNGSDSYGIVGYTHLSLQNAINMVGSGYGHSIVHFKLLGGTKDFIFFDADQDNTIRDMLIKSYGRYMTIEEQIYTLTGDSYIARKYANCRPSEFGKYGQSDIRKKTGKYIRGMVCDYWSSVGEVVVYPFNFGDMVACAVASGLSSYMSEAEVRKRFKGIMDNASRATQEDFIDIVPFLECFNAVDPDGCQYIKVGQYAYSAFDSPKGPNILVVKDSNQKTWHKPEFYKLFPDTIRLDTVPSNPSRNGNISFSMNKMRWGANVAGICPDGEQHLSQNGKPEPVFWLKDRGDTPFEWQYLEYMYQNPHWIIDYFNQADSDGGELNEGFKQGMTYNDFVGSNKAFGYVCAHADSVTGILTHGFSREWAAENDSNYNGGRGFYGNGVYGCVILGKPYSMINSNLDMAEAGAVRLSEYRDSSKSDGLKYGGVIIKCSIVGGWNNFLILDESLAKAVYKANWPIEKQIQQIVGKKNPTAAVELIRGMTCSEGFKYNVTDYDTRTTPPLAQLFRGSFSDFQKWENFFRKYGIRGAVYHGGNDGYGFVCYDYSEAVPIAVSYDHGKTWKTTESDWQKTHDRLLYAGDPINKLGTRFKSVSKFPKKVTAGEEVFGCVTVEKHNGKFNCVRMDTLNEIFPVDFDTEPAIGMSGKVRFTYRGYQFVGYIYNEDAGGPAFDYGGGTFAFNDLDGVIDYYIEGKYEEQDDTPDNGQLQESFFRFLDKMEGYLDD